MLTESLSYIAEKFNESGIIWAVGGSLLLNYYGLALNPKDIDILVDIKDVKVADSILKSIGKKKVSEKKNEYSTLYFYEYVINEEDVHLMAGITVNHKEGSFKYIFNNSSITKKEKINGHVIPMTPLEDWLVLYDLVPMESEKVKLIEDHIKENGIKNLASFKTALKGNLPYEVKKRVQKFLNLNLQ